MQIAIVGGGFAGLSLAYFLAKESSSCKLTLFDSSLCCKSASFFSFGLLHPFSGPSCKKSYLADEGMAASLKLIQEIQAKIDKPIITSKGIVRPALNAKQRDRFYKAYEKNQETSWWDTDDSQKVFPFLISQGALFIPSGVSIDSQSYIFGLINACKELSVQFVSQEISHLKELSYFDKIILCTGACKNLLTPVHLSYVKGQLIELKWPGELSILPYSLVSDCYISMTPSKKSCIVGATYERKFASAEPSSSCENELRLKASQMIPKLSQAPLLEIKSGVRCFSPNKIHPIICKQLSEAHKSLWIFTGLGSKGLLHHAYFAKILAQAVLNDTPELLPKETRSQI